MTTPHPPTTPHRATPEQWHDVEHEVSHNRWLLGSCVIQLRDTLAALERRVEVLEGPAADAAELRAALQQENQRRLAQETSATALASEHGSLVVEPFVVRHYTGNAHPEIKGNGFDGLTIGETREEAEEFIAWLNARLCPTSAPAAAPAPEHGSLVEVVAEAIDEHYLDDMDSTEPEARAAIAAIAQALRERGQVHTADWLEREARR